MSQQSSIRAIKQLRIEITPADIRNGLSCNGRHCPISLAVARALYKYNVTVLTEICLVQVTALSVGFNTWFIPKTFALTQRLQRFRHDIDGDMMSKEQLLLRYGNRKYRLKGC